MKRPIQPGFISINGFVRRSTLSRSTVYYLIQSGELPKPIRLTTNRIAWPAEEIEEWFAKKLAARDAE